LTTNKIVRSFLYDAVYGHNAREQDTPKLYVPLLPEEGEM